MYPEEVSDAKKQELEIISVKTREVFQNLLKSRVKDKTDIEALAQVLGKTTSLVKKMIYKGDGGLDVWVKAIAYAYKIDGENIQDFHNEFRINKPVKASDRAWFSIQDEFEVSEDEMLYLALCAKEAIRIKREIQNIKKRGEVSRRVKKIKNES